MIMILTTPDIYLKEYTNSSHRNQIDFISNNHAKIDLHISILQT